jgi:hypothetical protein
MLSSLHFIQYLYLIVALSTSYNIQNYEKGSCSTVKKMFQPDQLFPQNFTSLIFEKHILHIPATQSTKKVMNALDVTKTDMIKAIRSMNEQQARQHVKVASAESHKLESCKSDGRSCLANNMHTNINTIIMDGVENLFPSFFDFVAIWKQSFGVFVHANLYLTPPSQQGLLWHSDKSDAFILQLEGSKIWNVCERVLPNLNNEAFGEVMPFSSALASEDASLGQLIESCKTIEMKKGDILYLPAGFVHRATASSKSKVHSLHATVGLCRTHHQYAWSGIIGNLIPDDGDEENEKLFHWLHQVSSTMVEMNMIPKSFGDSTQHEYVKLSQWNHLIHSTNVYKDLPNNLLKRMRREWSQMIQPLLNKVHKKHTEAIATLIHKDVLLLQVLERTRDLMQRSFAPYKMLMNVGVGVLKRRSTSIKKLRRIASKLSNKIQLTSKVQREKNLFVLIDNKEKTISHHLERTIDDSIDSENVVRVPYKAWALSPKRAMEAVQYCLGYFQGVKGKVFLVEDLLNGVFRGSKRLKKKAITIIKWLVKKRLLAVVQEDRGTCEV